MSSGLRTQCTIRARGSAQLTLHFNGDLEVAALNGSLPLEGGVVPVPSGWSGVLDLGVDRASLRDGHVSALQGTLTARSLRMAHPGTDLGSFELTFPAAPVGDAPMLGTLRDLDGPLALQAHVQLARDGNYQLDGTVAARSTANADLQQLLQPAGRPL